jgi:hypothetical protein
MFDPNDFKHMSDNTDQAPDGLIDASDYAEDMSFVTNILSDIDYDDMISRMHAMMNILNQMYGDDNKMDTERVTGVTIALSFHIITLLNSLEEDSRQEYFQFIKDDVITEIEKEASSLPYWNLDETTDE